jgi:hypothetical protein
MAPATVAPLPEDAAVAEVDAAVAADAVADAADKPRLRWPAL